MGVKGAWRGATNKKGKDKGGRCGVRRGRGEKRGGGEGVNVEPRVESWEELEKNRSK